MITSASKPLTRARLTTCKRLHMEVEYGSRRAQRQVHGGRGPIRRLHGLRPRRRQDRQGRRPLRRRERSRSEEHTSELQSRQYLVCRLLLEKKKNLRYNKPIHNIRRRAQEILTHIL